MHLCTIPQRFGLIDKGAVGFTSDPAGRGNGIRNPRSRRQTVDAGAHDGATDKDNDRCGSCGGYGRGRRRRGGRRMEDDWGWVSAAQQQGAAADQH